MAKPESATPRSARFGDEPRQIGLLVGLGVSVLLHVILLLLAVWLPVFRPLAAIEIPEETVLEFDFAPVTETEQESSSDGAIPVEPNPVVPATLPQPPPAVPQTNPAAAMQPPQSQTAPLSAPRETEPELEPSPDPPPERTASAELPPDDAGRFVDRKEAPSEPRTSPQPSRRSFDLNRAITNFGDLLDRAREQQRAERSPSQRESHVYVPDLSSVPSAGYGMGNLTFETRDFDWSDYARQIYVAIWKAWHNRLYLSTAEFEKWARSNGWELRHQNSIRFVIERSGQVSEMFIEGPSGCVPLDASSTDALAEVILPPLPADFPKEREVVHARFIAVGDIRTMHRALDMLRRAGYFP